MADDEWATVPTKADREQKLKSKRQANAGANAAAAPSSSSHHGPIATVTGAATPGSLLLSQFQFLDDEEDIEAMRAKQRRAALASHARAAAEEADAAAAAAAARSSAAAAGKKKHAHKAKAPAAPQAPRPKPQPLRAVAAELDPAALASFLSELQRRYGGGADGEASQLRSLADFLLRHFSRAGRGGMERWAASLSSAAATEEGAAALVVAAVGGAGGKAGGKKKAAGASTAAAAALPATIVESPYSDLPTPLANALGSFASSCGAKALGALVDDLLSAALADVPARPKPQQQQEPPKVGLLVLLAAVLRARPAALLAALPALQRRAARASAPGVPPLLSPGALPLVLWTLAQPVSAGEPGVALAAWCRLVLPALVGEAELPTTAGKSDSDQAAAAASTAMDSRGRAAALAFGEALLTAVDGGSPAGPGGGTGFSSFFGLGGGQRRQQPLDVPLGDDLGHAPVVPGAAVELASAAAFEAERNEEQEEQEGKRGRDDAVASVRSRLATLHPRLQAAAARSARPEQYREWLSLAIARSGRMAAAAGGGKSGGGFSSSSNLARRSAASVALCLAGDAGCFELWERTLHHSRGGSSSLLEASAAVLSAMDEALLAPVMAAPPLKAAPAPAKAAAAAGGASSASTPLLACGGAPAARELFAVRLPARHRPALLAGAADAGKSQASSSSTAERAAAAEAEAACERLACGRVLGAAALYRASGGDAARTAAIRVLQTAASAAATANKKGAAAGSSSATSSYRQRQRQRRRGSGGGGGSTRRRRGSFAGAAFRWLLTLGLLVALCARHRRADAVAALASALGAPAAARADELVLLPLQRAVVRFEKAAGPVVLPLVSQARHAVWDPLVERAAPVVRPAVEAARPHFNAAVAAWRPAVRSARIKFEAMRAGQHAAAGESLAKAAALVRTAAKAVADEARGIVERGRAAAKRDAAEAAATAAAAAAAT